MIRSLILFVHVTSAMGIVAAMAIEAVALLQFTRARSGAALQSALGGLPYAQRVGGASMLLTVLSGIYLATVLWRWQGPWIGMAFMLLIVNAIIGATLTGRGLAPVLRMVREGAPGEQLVAEAARIRRSLRISFALRLSLLLGIVFLMTVKPGSTLGAAVAIGALLIGLGVGLAGGSQARGLEGATI